MQPVDITQIGIERPCSGPEMCNTPVQLPRLLARFHVHVLALLAALCLSICERREHLKTNFIRERFVLFL